MDCCNEDYKRYYSIICLSLISTNELNEKYCNIFEYVFSPQNIDYNFVIKSLEDIKNQLESVKSGQYTACKKIIEKMMMNLAIH